MPSAGKICKSHLEAAGSCDKDAERGPRGGQGLPPSYRRTRLGHSGVGSLKSRFPGALESRSVEWSLTSRVKFFCCFQGVVCGKHRKGPTKAASLHFMESASVVPSQALPHTWSHLLGTPCEASVAGPAPLLVDVA